MQTDPKAATAPLSEQDAARFLTQATLGYTREDIAQVQALGPAGWIEAQFQAPAMTGHCEWLLKEGYADPANIDDTTGLDGSIWRRLIAHADPLRQRMALALSEILVAGTAGVKSRWTAFSVGHYLDLLEAQAFGNYRTLLEQVSTSPAMGDYLTYRGNRRADPASGSQPDENYAREIMQLFSIGLVELNADGSPRVDARGAPIETYVQQDVSQLARVFTGWNWDLSGHALDPEGRLTATAAVVQQRPMVCDAAHHEPGAKRFLGTTIAAGTPPQAALTQALDTLFRHPNVGPFIGRQLIQRMVTSHPAPAYVARVTAAFNDNGAGVRGDLKAVLRAVLLDPEARSTERAAAPDFGRVREPAVRFLNWARAFGARSSSQQWKVGDTSDPATRLGQSPMRSPSVFNFFRPGYVPPNTQIAQRGMTAPEFQIVTESSVSGYVNYMQGVVSGGAGGKDVKANYAPLMPLAADAGGLLAELNLRLAAGQVSAPTLARLTQAVGSMPAASDAHKLSRIHAALTLVMAAPEYIVQK